jgi:hypothetical protein
MRLAGFFGEDFGAELGCCPDAPTDEKQVRVTGLSEGSGLCALT